jgi:hypothetical protein
MMPRHRVGAQDLLAAAPDRHAGPPVGDRKRNKAGRGEGLDIGPQRREMMRATDRHGGDPLRPRLFAQQCGARPQGRLRKTVRGISRKEPRRYIGYDRYRLAVDPSTLQGRDVAGKPEQPVAGAAVALRRRDDFGNTIGILRRHAMPHKDPGDEVGELLDAHHGAHSRSPSNGKWVEPERPHVDVGRAVGSQPGSSGERQVAPAFSIPTTRSSTNTAATAR